MSSQTAGQIDGRKESELVQSTKIQGFSDISEGIPNVSVCYQNFSIKTEQFLQ